MSDTPTNRRSSGASPVPDKEPPPGLSARAARPRAVRLRGGVVRLVMIGGIVLVSGALAWAFVVQPERRGAARERAVEDRRTEAWRNVRPADAVTDQPASYDRLPPSRAAQADHPPALSEPPAPGTDPRTVRHPPRPLSSAPSPLALAAQSGLFFDDLDGGRASIRTGPATPEPAPPAPGGPERRGVSAAYNPHRLTAPVSPYELKAGAMVPAVLLTGVDTARSGPIVATVSQNVFDTISGRYLLLPQGTRLIGASEGESRYGDHRAFIAWKRIILPNGKSLLLDDEAGVDAQGAVGVRGQVDRRLVPLALGTLFGGAITALGQAARDGERGGGLWGDVGDAAAIEGAQVGSRLVDRELTVRPSVRLEVGTRVRVMITRDLILEPYAP